MRLGRSWCICLGINETRNETGDDRRRAACFGQLYRASSNDALASLLPFRLLIPACPSREGSEEPELHPAGYHTARPARATTSGNKTKKSEQHLERVAQCQSAVPGPRGVQVANSAADPIVGLPTKNSKAEVLVWTALTMRALTVLFHGLVLRSLVSENLNVVTPNDPPEKPATQEN